MRLVDEYRNAELSRTIIERIHRHSKKPVRLMEFCGGHTVSILKNGIRQLLPVNIEMLSGPGCPVCVTATADLDKAIALARIPGVIITTFGDMIRVPGSYSSLQQVKAEGSDIRIVYSTQDALETARRNPLKAVIFIGIGFETTAPTIAASILEAELEELNNYYVLSLHKLCPPVIKVLLNSGEIRLDGIVCPGHVSAIIGSSPYNFIPRDYGIACVISGFEPVDILQGVDMLVAQIENNEPGVEIAYRRGVRQEGNQIALQVLGQVFEPSDANWRGIGTITGSGLALRQEYRRFDAEYAFEIGVASPREPEGCLCGDILRGVNTPLDCKLFRRVCRLFPFAVNRDRALAESYPFRPDRLSF